MQKKIRKSLYYKRNHKNIKNQGIISEFTEFLDRRIDKEFDQERTRLQNLISQYVQCNVRQVPLSLMRQVTVSLDIPDPVYNDDWERSVKEVINGLGEKVIREILSSHYGKPRYIPGLS